MPRKLRFKYSRHIQSKAVSFEGLFLWGCIHISLCFSGKLCPVKRGNHSCSSRHEFDYPCRDTQTSFSLLYCRSRETFGLLVAQFSILILEMKTTWSNRAPFWSTVTFLTTQLKNEPLIVGNFRNCDPREAGNGSRYLSESSQTHSEKSRLDFFALWGKL